MKLSEIKINLEQNLEAHLKTQLPNHPFHEVYLYSALPPGKLFRPLLATAILNDFTPGDPFFSSTSAHSYFCSAIELHHAYTLVHDDLPCMDNDDFRRGRPTVHKQFGQWQALLAGDGLLNCSYGLLSKMNSSELQKVFKLVTWALGPKGLIQGQVLDLSEEMKKDFESLVLTHEYKTARLIQVALCGSFLLIQNKKKSAFSENRMFLDLFKLGHHTGVTFQLLDDLTELCDAQISPHELSINPWFYFQDEALKKISQGLNTIKIISDKHEMDSFHLVMKDYFSKIHLKLNENIHHVAQHQKRPVADLIPMMSLLKGLC